MQEKSKAVFLDRDGTIIEDTGYIKSPAEVKFLPGAIEAVKLLNDAGYKVVIISNQSGIARGIFNEGMLQSIDKTIHRHILGGGGHIDASYYCPHHAEHGVYPYKQVCECRKPHPGLVKKAEKENNIDLAKSFFIGDKASDLKTGQCVGLKTILVHDHDEKEGLKDKPDHKAESLLEATRWILNGKS